ncbi:MAG: hypothetical protein JO306_04530, partial [Gemmatimonadetes bacterium]|nr:hypothetical protein [Gemmatimonadota bacterium]
MITTAATLLLLAAAPADTTPAAPLSEAVVASAYADPQARELVRRAREYRRSVDLSVRSYRSLARQRVSAGLRTVLRERSLFGQELAARIDWHRQGTVRVQLVGARQRVIADDDDDPGDDYRSEARDLVFDPADDRMKMGLLGGETWIRHPLAEGSERDYRFRAGDTMTVRLSGGQTVRVYELRVEPRHLDAPLVSGSIWLEDRSFGVVRTLLRLSRTLTQELHTESRRDSTGGRQVMVSAHIGGDSTAARRRHRRGGWWEGMVPQLRIDVRYMTTEYALVQGKWWMPTLSAVDATATAGGFSMPVRYERTYTEYQVEGDAVPAPGALASGSAPAATVIRPDTPQVCREKGNCQCALGLCRPVELELPADTAALAVSPDLPPPLEQGAPLMTGKEAGDLAGELN